MKARIIALVLSVSVCVVTSNGQDIDDAIQSPERSAFSQYYESYEVGIEADARGYQLPLDINDIVNFKDVGKVIDMNDISGLIRQNGFAVLETGVYSEFSSHDFDTIYGTLHWLKFPTFVTSDTGLFIYHTLLADTLKGIKEPDLSDIWLHNSDPNSQPFTIYKETNRIVRGLDLMALLGSDEALKCLTNEGNTDHERYGLQLSKLKDKVDTLDHINWHANLYWSWLYCIQALFREVPEGYPDFLRTETWNRLQLNTALASWTQFQDDVTRHYDPAEPQPMALGITMPLRSPPPASVGYVEPNPLFWGRLLSLTRMTSKGLEDLNVLTSEARQRFTEFEKLLQQILYIVSKQLTCKPLSPENCDFFDKLPSILCFMLPGVQKHGLATVLTGNVRTNETNAMGIEQAVGDIDLIIVACPMPDGKIKLAVGPVHSYYEFKNPMSDKPTDKSWRLILNNSSRRPKRPGWYVPLLRLKNNSSGFTRLTNHLFDCWDPYWLRDGNIAFLVTNKDWNHDIYIMNPDGRDVKKLTNISDIHLGPHLSPDQKMIAFVKDDRPDNYCDIYVVNSDGSGLKRLTDNNTDNFSPCWSPDGEKIAFESGKYSNHEICIMNADGSEKKRLTNNDDSNTSPSWSPDGKKIAFVLFRDGNADIYIMNSEGREQKRLTNNPSSDRNPCWSPDGQQIVFASHRDGNFEIYVMNANGSEQKRLTNNLAEDKEPCWSPDGKKIAFRSTIAGNSGIFIMDLDSRNK